MSEAIRTKWRAWRHRLFLDRRPIRFMLRHLVPGDTAVDIGAYKGVYAYWMLRAVGESGRVVCFEPQPAMIKHLNRLKESLHLKRLEVVPGATHLFEEAGALESVAHLAGEWFAAHLAPAGD